MASIKDMNLFAANLQDMKTGLTALEKSLETVDQEISGKPKHEQDFILAQKQSGFDAVVNVYLDILEPHVAALNPQQRLAEGALFRQAVGPFLAQAPFIHRTNTRPRGYAGDSEMMRMIYANGWQGDTAFGKLLHHYTLGVPPAEAVRNRRPLITNELRLRGESVVPGQPLQLLSVACGPANEISDIFKDVGDFSKYHITLLDQDAEAIGEARANIVAAEQRCGAKAHVRYQQSSIGVFLKPNKVIDSLGKFDFIYSMGLYDYLDDKTARKLTNALFDLLKPNGTLLLGNYTHLGVQDLIRLEYFCDWRLIYRDQQEFGALLDPSRSKDVVVGLEPSGTQMFLRARKAANDNIDTVAAKARL